MRSTMRKARFASLSLAVLLGTAVAGQVKDADLLKPDPERLPSVFGQLRFAAALASQADHDRECRPAAGEVDVSSHRRKDLEAPPIVYKGVMYVGQYNRVHALDAATGRLIWEHFRQPASVGWQRGIGIYGDMVYMVAQDPRSSRSIAARATPCGKRGHRRPANVSRDRCRLPRRV